MAHAHEPRHVRLNAEARERGADPPPLPDRIEEVPSGESYVTGCPGCRVVSHVIGHRADS